MKNILLIGGSYGIGQSLIQLLKNDYNIYVACRTEDFEQKAHVQYKKFDVTKDNFSTDWLPEVLDGFVYFPGSILLKPFKNLKINNFEEDFNLNFLKMVHILQLILPNLQKSEQSSVVLFSSVAASIGMPFHTSVAASKSAIEGFAKSFAAEMSPKIRMNVIAPSLTNTPLSNKFLNTQEKIDRASQRHPLKRIGTPEDMASTAQFLLSNQSSWMTGQVLHNDGGMSTLNIGM